MLWKVKNWQLKWIHKYADKLILRQRHLNLLILLITLICVVNVDAANNYPTPRSLDAKELQKAYDHLRSLQSNKGTTNDHGKLNNSFPTSFCAFLYFTTYVNNHHVHD